jgi:predicted RNA-binding protein with PUA-like domain
MNYWLIKSEPYKYSFAQMKEDGETYWDGVRSYPARIHLRAMEVGDICLFYHSNEGKEIVGEVEVIKEAYQDPTTDDDRWVAVDVRYKNTYKQPVTLAQIKGTTELSEMKLVKQSRLSVSPVTEGEYEVIKSMSESTNG